MDTRSKEVVNQKRFSGSSFASQWQIVDEVGLDYIEMNSDQIGGVGKILKLDKLKFGKTKYHRGHPVEGHFFFVVLR